MFSQNDRVNFSRFFRTRTKLHNTIFKHYPKNFIYSENRFLEIDDYNIIKLYYY